MRTTFTINFYCRESKKNKKGFAPIECSIIICGNRCIINLPRQEEPKVFNRKKQPKELVDYLSIERVKINETINQLMMNSIPVTPDNLRKYLRTGGVQSYKINDMFNDYLNILKKRIDVDLTLDVYRKYELVSKWVLNKIDGNNEINELTPGVMLNITNQIKEQFKISTAAGYITKIKTFCTYAMDNNYLKINPFQNIKITKAKTNIVYLTDEEINKLHTYNFDNQSIQRVVDCCLFQAATGLSYADMADLQRDDLKFSGNGYYIQKQRKKNGQTYTAVVLPLGVEIWNKYDGKLPVISNQKSNVYIKVATNLCGIKKDIHTHIFRKTYACHLLRSGVRMEVVSKTLGHSSVKITQAAYATLSDLDIISEVNKTLQNR